MAKNIVVCCDGTGNQFGRENSNVVKFYTCLKVGAEQRAYYHPGVGTMGDPRRSSRWAKEWSRIKGLAFGAGFTANMADAYKYLMETYEDGDRIYLVGFSRGAYTVRALGGALFMYGLLCPGNEEHLSYLLDMYSDASREAYNKKKKGQKASIQETAESRGFRETFSRRVEIHFMGLWDTVSSVGWIYDPVKLLFEGQNPILRKGRHAISVDERRCFYQSNLWGEPLNLESRLALDPKLPATDDQDIVQAWFAGAHSDVGGSYLHAEAAPAMDALKWLLEEAKDDHLLIDDDKQACVFGEGSSEFPHLCALYPKVSEGVKVHESLCGPWWLLEFFPHKYFDQAGEKHWRFSPWPHRRELPDQALIHPSLRKRLKLQEYTPKNLAAKNVKDYSEAPVPMLYPKVMAQLEEKQFGVYQAPGPADKLPRPAVVAVTAVAVTAVAASGLALLLRKR